MSPTRGFTAQPRSKYEGSFELERELLSPLPVDRFPFFNEARRSVNRDGHVEIATAYYSAPPEYVGRRLWARWDSRLVRLFKRVLRVLKGAGCQAQDRGSQRRL